MSRWILFSWILLCTAVVADATLQAEQQNDIQRLTGNVTDEVGQPIAGVRVDISTAAPKVGEGIFCPSCYLDCGKWAKTNDVGEFSFDKLDPSLKFRLVAAAPGHRATQTELVSPDAGPVKITLAKMPTDIAPAQVLSGVVLSHLGAPIEGALVEPFGAETANKRWFGTIHVDSTVTDHQGRFAIILPKDFLGMDVRVFADGFCSLQSGLLAPGPNVAQLQMDEGARVIGKLVRAGVPVSQMSIAVVQVDRSIHNGIFIRAVADLTHEDGSFEFKNLPPNQKYAIFSVVGDARRTKNDYVLATKTFSVGSSGETRDLGKLSVTNPVTLRGKVASSDGKPLSSDIKMLFGRDPAWDLISSPLNADGTFEIVGLPPETYAVSVVGRGLQIVTENFPFQMLGPQSFGVHLSASSNAQDISIQVKSK